MNKILKSFSFVAFCFCFTNAFSAQTQITPDGLAKKEFKEADLNQIFNLIKEVKDINNKSNSLTIGKILGNASIELLFLSNSAIMGFLIAALLDNQLIRIFGYSGLRDIILVVGASISVYGFTKLFLNIKNRLNASEHLDNQTIEKLAKVEKLLEQLEVAQKLKDSELNQQVQNPVK
jgi:hypothetical protein